LALGLRVARGRHHAWPTAAAISADALVLSLFLSLFLSPPFSFLSLFFFSFPLSFSFSSPSLSLSTLPAPERRPLARSPLPRDPTASPSLLGRPAPRLLLGPLDRVHARRP